MERYVTVLDNLAGSPHGEDRVISEQTLGKCRGAGKADTGGRWGKRSRQRKWPEHKPKAGGGRRAWLLMRASEG